jgi:dipeptidyl aminopeptidase/acylaminoacyl peptidase
VIYYTHQLKLIIFVGLIFACAASIQAVSARTRLAFIAYDSGIYLNIYIMDPDGSNQINISNNAVSDSSPRFSPDGRKIVFQRYDSNSDFYIYTMNANGTNQTRIDTPFPGESPSWSPDGTRIIFNSSRGEIWVMKADGTELTDLTAGREQSRNPVFSPDASRIAYACYRLCDTCIPPVSSEDVCVMNADGTNEINLSGTSSENESGPAFSPDGTQIGYTTHSFRDRVSVMNTDGSNKRDLAENGIFSAWSPDGTKIAFYRYHDIWIMNADGTGQNQITTGPYDYFASSWARVPDNAAPFDFDGDRKTDLSVFRDGTWYIDRSSEPGGFYGMPWGLTTDKLVPADFDGDGKTDIAVWRENLLGTHGYFFIIRSSDNTVSMPAFGQTGDDPSVVGDWDGDGIADLAVYRNGATAEAQSYFYYRPSSRILVDFVPVFWGTAGDEPLRGDFDGDGRIDASVFRPSDGVWYILQSSNSQPRYAYSGVASDKRVSGDFDGDGKTDLAIFHDGLWAVLQSSNNQDLYRWWGLPTDTLVPGDYDGDGRTDFAVWRDGIYYILPNSSGQPLYRQFGQPGDIPAASAFIH